MWLHCEFKWLKCGFMCGSWPILISAAFTLTLAAFLKLPQVCVIFSVSSASDLIKSVNRDSFHSATQLQQRAPERAEYKEKKYPKVISSY